MPAQTLPLRMKSDYQAGNPLPVATGERADLDLPAAYGIQHAYVAARLQSESIAGFKAGATAPGPQRAFGLSEPITGVLFASGARENGARIRLGDFRALMLEVELGFRLGRAITEAPRDVAALREAVSAVLPMVELAEIPFGGAAFTGLDLIAANSASCAFMAGDEPAWRDTDINAITVRFARDGEVLHEAPASDVMGDQWQALLWLVGRVLEQGYSLEPGHLLMTGSIGAAHPGKPGRYEADFGDFGRLAFQVTG